MSTSVIESLIARDQHIYEPGVERTDDAWNPFYRIGAGAALLSVGLIVLAGVMFAVNPTPTTMTGWFDLFNRNWLLGLFAADLMMLLSYLLLGLIYFALYGALRRVNQPFMALATIIAFVGMAAYYAANPAFSMLSLSRQYAEASTDAERTALLGAGHAVIANWTGTAFDVAYLFGGVTAIIVSAIMLRSRVFGKLTAYTGLLMGVLTLVPASLGTLGVVLSLIALVPTVIWLILVARRLFQLGGAS